MDKIGVIIHKGMINITRGTNNTVQFTLNERKTLDNPYYLVRVENLTTRKVKRFILASDLSGYTERFDEFLITESSSELLTSGTVDLSPAGDWAYRVYEQASSTNLNEDAALKLLEEGIMKVKDSTDSNTYHYFDGQDKEYTV